MPVALSVYHSIVCSRAQEQAV